MKFEQGYISLRGMRFHAFHGVLPQERLVGGDYEVDLRVGYPLAKAIISDRVEDTLNYASLYSLVEREMKQPSSLLEHVSGRIAEAVCKAFPKALSIDLTLTKLNPPMEADCDGASVEIHFINDNNN